MTSPARLWELPGQAVGRAPGASDAAAGAGSLAFASFAGASLALAFAALVFTALSLALYWRRPTAVRLGPLIGVALTAALLPQFALFAYEATRRHDNMLDSCCPVGAAASSPDASRLATAYLGTVYLYDAATGAEIVVLQGPTRERRQEPATFWWWNLIGRV
ncbi:MAG TPA: hypothetical protein VLD35_00010 [Caldimonas sp.]|nr:hypothetical protein [Caldimonas sp.]